MRGWRLTVVLAGAALLCAAGSARPEQADTLRRIEEPPASVQQNEITRFCTNVTDAARDRRYAMQAEELKKLESEIDERIAALETKRKEYEDWLGRRREFMKMAEDNIVEIYASMRPDAAAERMAALDGELAAAILIKLDSRKAGVILNEMDSNTAAALTGIIASAARKEDPS